MYVVHVNGDMLHAHLFISSRLQVDTAVKELRARTQSDAPPAAMLSHSAGGWLARVYLSDFGTEGFDRLVSLGSPHNPPPSGAKIVDQTRGILTFCETNYPGAFHGAVRSETFITTCPWKDSS